MCEKLPLRFRRCAWELLCLIISIHIDEDAEEVMCPFMTIQLFWVGGERDQSCD